MSSPRRKDSPPRGFMPKAPLTTSTQKRDQKGNDRKVPEMKLDVQDKPVIELSKDEEEENVIETEEVKEEIPNFSNNVSVARNNQVVENGRLKAAQEAALKVKLEMEEKLRLEMEENLRKQEIAKLAQETLSLGNKMFVYPKVVKPGEDIEVFLNRSISTLVNEPDVLIMGAFNDWRWKSFTFRLSKTNLVGDWWSCLIHVPKEAYKIDFVFFNGQEVYDNNNQKDYCINVEGGMSVFAFQDFLLEEKRREQEKLAKEQAERERQEEERRRIEAENAAREADRVQALVETQRKRDMLEGFMKMEGGSVDDVWYIEPREFEGEDLVKIYYSRSSGPLANANEVWIHGGHNNWESGLSIVGKLVRAERTNGDWWCAEGMYR